ncbi:MAG: hypothetical protein WD000_03400 [Thermodesulfobacteriota bacterium]
MPSPFERAPQPIDPVESAKQAVMTAEQYAGIEHDIPYVYDVEANNKKVTYFGVGHSWDPKDPVWEKLKIQFVGAKPNIVLVEGFDNLSSRKKEVIDSAEKYSEDVVIGKMGESGLALKLAIEKGIDFDSPEPAFKEEIKYIEEQGLSREAIFGYYIFRMIPQWQQHQEKEDFRNYIEREIDSIQHATQWDDFDYSYENINRIAQQFWGEGINLDDPDYYSRKVNPIPWEEKKTSQTEVNLAARFSSRFRDQYMIGKIAEYLEHYDRIFIVYGASHAVMQESAIKELMK